MNVTPEQKERFKSMVRNFAVKNDILFNIKEYSDRPRVLEVNLAKRGDPEYTTYIVNFDNVCSLTEAGTWIFTDASIRLGLGPASNPVVAKRPTIANVIYNPPATVVFWSDGSKTVVKCGENDTFDPEKGLAMAISKKMLGNQGNYYNEFKKWTAKCEVESLYPKFAVPTLGIAWEPPKLADIIHDRVASIFRRGALG